MLSRLYHLYWCISVFLFCFCRTSPLTATTTRAPSFPSSLSYRQAVEAIKQGNVQLIRESRIKDSLVSPDGSNTLLHVAAIWGHCEILEVILQKSAVEEEVMTSEGISFEKIVSERVVSERVGVSPKKMPSEVMPSENISSKKMSSLSRSNSTSHPLSKSRSNSLSISIPTNETVKVKRTFSYSSFPFLSSPARSRPGSPVQVQSAILDAFDGRGYTALHGAICMGHVEVVRLLLSSGADPNLPDRVSSKDSLRQLSPLQLAFKYRRPEIARIVMGYSVDYAYTTPGKLRNVWHYAARYCDAADVLSMLPMDADLLGCKDYKGLVPIHRAARACNMTAIALIENSVTIDGTSVDAILRANNCKPRPADKCVIC